MSEIKTFEGLVYEGQIYIKASSIDLPLSATVQDKQTPEPQRKRGRKPKAGSGWAKVKNDIAEHERKKRKRLGPEAEETIMQDIRENGLGLTEACKKYGISVGTYYRLKEDSKNGPVREEIETEDLQE